MLLESLSLSITGDSKINGTFKHNLTIVWKVDGLSTTTVSSLIFYVHVHNTSLDTLVLHRTLPLGLKIELTNFDNIQVKEDSPYKNIQSRMSAVFSRPDGGDKSEIRLTITNLALEDDEFPIILLEDITKESKSTLLSVNSKYSCLFVKTTKEMELFSCFVGRIGGNLDKIHYYR